jgi:hypothetical protein
LIKLIKLNDTNKKLFFEVSKLNISPVITYIMSEQSETNFKTTNTGDSSPQDLDAEGRKKIFLASLKHNLEVLKKKGTPLSRNRIPYLNDRQTGHFKERYMERPRKPGMTTAISEKVELGARCFVTHDGKKYDTWCILGQDCPCRKPVWEQGAIVSTKNGDVTMNGFVDGDCKLFHSQMHIGKTCKDGINCILLDHTLKSTKPGSPHFCPDHHPVEVEFACSDSLTSTDQHKDPLSRKTIVVKVCTACHRPGREGKPLDHKGKDACAGLHFVKKDENGNEVTASLVDDLEIGYIKVMGFTRVGKKTVYTDLSYPDDAYMRLMRIVSTDPNIPDSICDRLWYDCSPECQAKESANGKINHMCVVKPVIVRFDRATRTKTSLNLSMMFRMIINSDHPEDEQDPDFLTKGDLINWEKTEERRKVREDPYGSYVANNSWGAKIDKDTSLSVFISTGSNTFHD